MVRINLIGSVVDVIARGARDLRCDIEMMESNDLRPHLLDHPYDPGIPDAEWNALIATERMALEELERPIFEMERDGRELTNPNPEEILIAREGS